MWEIDILNRFYDFQMISDGFDEMRSNLEMKFWFFHEIAKFFVQKEMKRNKTLRIWFRIHNYWAPKNVRYIIIDPKKMSVTLLLPP